MDGWRMDVANMTGRSGRVDLNHRVARAMRRTLQATNPDALLIAEHCFDASDLLEGDAFHGTMSYAAFARPVWAWLQAQTGPELAAMSVPAPRLPGPTVAATMTAFRAAVPWRASLHNFNQLSSHDTARFRTIVGGADARDAQLAGAGLLFTSPGIPVVFAGDEVGLEGVEALDARQPMPWDRTRWDTATLDGYRRLIRLRRAHPALRRGGFRWAHVGDDVLCYLRENRQERLLVAIARVEHAPVPVPAAPLGAAGAEHLLGGPDLSPAADGTLTLPGSPGPAVHVWRLGDAATDT